MMVDALSGEQYAIRQQAIANEDPSASAWFTASPACPENQMNSLHSEEEYRTPIRCFDI
jgi:hypothetical protein